MPGLFTLKRKLTLIMKLKTLASGLFALALVFASAVPAAAQMKLYYNPSNGNMKLQNITSSTIGVQSFDIITLGNGSTGAVSGNPGNVGFLSGSAALFPAFNFITSNTSVNGYNGLYSQAGAANIGSAGLTLSPYSAWSTSSPIGPVGSYWDLGNIAVTGMNAGQINTRFLTDPELYDPQQFGRILSSYNTNGGAFTQTLPMDIVVFNPVPEPSTYAMAFAGLATCGFTMWRRRRTA